MLLNIQLGSESEMFRSCKFKFYVHLVYSVYSDMSVEKCLPFNLYGHLEPLRIFL